MEYFKLFIGRSVNKLSVQVEDSLKVDPTYAFYLCAAG